MTIRNERPEDFRAVEELTKKAFWNVNVPECSEHYLVHILRSHADFVPELDFVAEFDGKIIANIMFTRSRLRGEDGTEKEVLTFGPLSVLPEYQRQGYGKALLEYALKDGALSDNKWIFSESSAYEFDEKAAEEFDKSFPKMSEERLPSQELFYIYSNSRLC